MMQMASGILGYLDWTDDQKAEAARLREEEAQREAAAADWGAELRRRCAEIDRFAGMHMGAQLECQRPIVRPIDKQRFREVQAFCARNDWPTTLPIMPHALYEFIVTESGKGHKHILQIAKSIRKIHEAAGEHACPTRDPLVTAFLDLVREEETETATKGNREWQNTRKVSPTAVKETHLPTIGS
jgi:hypothetical protein